MSTSIKTIIHTARFDVRKPEDAAALAELQKRLNRPGLPRCHGPVWAGESEYHEKLRGMNGATVELECTHLFDNQWNTACGLRVFDFALHRWPQNRSLYDAQWLEQTEGMREIRRNIHKCGYCGAHEPAAKGYIFCPHCLDSEYLKESDLALTRMRPAGEDFTAKRGPLTEAECAHLLPLYRDAQLHGSTERGKKRIIKARADLHAEYEKRIREATIERDGFLWLIDRGIKTDNCIYYSHTDRFSFGWRQPVDEAIKCALLDVMSEFPFRYEIKCADGRTLNNE